jgi:catechol 2,3-dioxygenase-like lactoylglutathione lyase family enzyme
LLEVIVRVSSVSVIFLIGFAAGLLTASQKQESAALLAERATGIGGVFFKARDPKALGAGYQEKLGLGLQGGSQVSLFYWRERDDPERTGTTVWSLFPADTEYFAPSQARFMINYRVRNLDRMLAQLRASGVQVESKIAEEFNGRFAWVVAPEGNKIELWEPRAGY